MSAPTIAVHLVDPFLLGANLSNIDLTPLYHAQNWPDVQANGLSADGVSAAIAVVQTNDCANDVNLTTTNGTTLLPWSANFLTTAPAAGTQSLPIPVANLDRAGAFFYGAALVQAPVGAPAPSFTTPIVVTAQQGSQSVNAQASLVPPPVVLVHGLWGDKTSLGGIDGLGHYLKTTPPWLNHPDLVKVLCYSKYFGFDAPIDPLSAGSSDPCEQTSRDAIASTISGLLSTLDSLKIVGSRVDVIAHSMGGLAARYYASKKKSYYGLLRNRTKGQFHEIITFDTPELGSKLAHFLNKHSDCHGQQTSTDWLAFCGGIPITTVAQCFAGRGLPLYAPGYDLNLGAVYSLYPNGPALQNPNLPGPNIPGVAFKEVAANINLPSRLPAQCHADTFAVTAIRFDLDNPSLRLQPWAIYANIPERVYLDTRYVSYSIPPGVEPPVVSLDPNGVVHGLRTGTATIIARFGLLTDQVRVNVEAEQR